jgi:hypothetical protein
MTAQGTLKDACEKVLEFLESDGEVITITGDDGLQFKVFVNACVCPKLQGERSTSFGRGDCCSTKVNDHARNVCRKLRGQQLRLSLLLSYRLSAINVRTCSGVGRVDHDPNAEFEDNHYEVHFSFSCLVALYVPIMQTSEKTARDSNLIALFEVLKFTVIPTKYHHILMEEYFEDPVC